VGLDLPRYSRLRDRIDEVCGIRGPSASVSDRIDLKCALNSLHSPAPGAFRNLHFVHLAPSPEPPRFAELGSRGVFSRPNRQKSGRREASAWRIFFSRR